jgi:hypothetical protein
MYTTSKVVVSLEISIVLLEALNFLVFTEPECLLLCIRKPVIGHHLKPSEYSPQINITPLYRLRLGISKVRDNSEDLGVGVRITLRWTLGRQESKGRTGFGWLRIWSSGGLL